MMRCRMLLVFVIAAFLTVLGIGHTLASSTPAGAPVVLAAGTPEAVGAWTLTTQSAKEDSQKPAYTITTNKPVLEASGGKASAFNKAVDSFVASAIANFKKSVQEFESVPAPAPDTSSALDIGYDVYATNRGLISVKFSVYFYIRGAAHPDDFSSSLNYNLASGEVLTLASLFTPDAKYLDVIANYCTQELQRQGKLTFPEGATAKAENYARWNLDRGGLMITFDTYQVGTRPEGPSLILVPYSVLADLLKPDGPVAP
jgi:hypothetical protein